MDWLLLIAITLAIIVAGSLAEVLDIEVQRWRRRRHREES